MKKLLIGLLALGTMSAFAGTLVNERTNEEIVFKLDQNKKVVEISGSYNGNIYFKSMTRDKANPHYYGMTEWITNDEGMSVLLVTIGTGAIVAGVADTLAVPFIAINASIKNAKYEKTHRLLMSIIGSDQILKVKGKRFDKILDYLLQFH